ncbi:uncharacterized protein ARMOST_04869 [Armillaria ostoyae]|uniref:Uncharacterized protein n=1 Tax=Armillaria ostoyae TaxID=47428 RepID=A0A284QYK0_ARMOS|nr:uncharacterized protein ARMOST_04869 [Armillaria ostoyae]
MSEHSGYYLCRQSVPTRPEDCERTKETSTHLTRTMTVPAGQGTEEVINEWCVGGVSLMKLRKLDWTLINMITGRLYGCPP